MRAIIIPVCGLLYGMTSLAMAASLYYAGSDTGWWEVAGNWKTDSPDGGVSPAKPVTGDSMYIGASGPINVKIGSNGGNSLFYGMNVDIAAGSSLTVTTNDAKFWGSTFNIASANALIFTNNVWGDYKNGATGVGASPLTFNLGSEGSVSYTANFNNSSSTHFNFNGTLNILNSGEFSVERRTLMTFGTNGDALAFDFNLFNVNFTADGTLTQYAQDASLTASESDLGKYKLVYDAAGKELYVEYVTGSIPEPSSSLLGLFGLGILTIRRRRQ